jgi:hypothetical protein
MRRREPFGIRHAVLALLAGSLAACTTGAGLAPGSGTGPDLRQPDEAAMRAAIEQYLLSRNVGNAADRPRYLNATRIHRFQKRGCEPASAAPEVICAFLLETGTTYREARFSSHRFEQVEGRWVSRGPVRRR